MNFLMSAMTVYGLEFPPLQTFWAKSRSPQRGAFKKERVIAPERSVGTA
jgi:hypothetical protein